jgi:L-threonylcarbamoyladenylate synthase
VDSSHGFEQALPTEMALIDFQKAVEILKTEDVLGIPTETVYGLAARIDSEVALKKIFVTKQRPFFDPLIVHLAPSFDPRDYTTQWTQLYEALCEKFWPGPLTLIAPKNGRISDLITAGLPDVGLRMPSHPLTEKLIEAVGVALAAPSANMFKKTSPTTARHVEEEFGGRVNVLDGGPSQVGVESTVVRYDETEKKLSLLRPGFISKSQLEDVARKFSIKVEPGTSKSAPGQMQAHYQPKAPVVLEYTNESALSRSHRILLEQRLEKTNLHWNIFPLLSPPEMVARTLYSRLRDLSKEGNAAIWIPCPPEFKDLESWTAVLDRLHRAASLILH